jgi:tetratricopeptide (TPR) repeat protein
VKPRRQWSYAGHPYLSGDIQSARLDVAALGLVPLSLEDQGIWDPREHYWGEDDEPIEEWAKPIIARGPRREFEMEQVMPGSDPDDPDSDPISQSNDLKDAGDRGEAFRILMELCQADLRCLDAHAHLGNLEFDHHPALAIRHYEAGLRIGELSVGEAFDGLLPWGWVDNRPFLRCMHSFGLCCWRLGRFEEAERVFGRMLWLNPSDNQGVRFLVDAVRTKSPWERSTRE